EKFLDAVSIHIHDTKVVGFDVGREGLGERICAEDFRGRVAEVIVLTRVLVNEDSGSTVGKGMLLGFIPVLPADEYDLSEAIPIQVPARCVPGSTRADTRHRVVRGGVDELPLVRTLNFEYMNPLAAGVVGQKDFDLPVTVEVEGTVDGQRTTELAAHHPVLVRHSRLGGSRSAAAVVDLLPDGYCRHDTTRDHERRNSVDNMVKVCGRSMSVHATRGRAWVECARAAATSEKRRRGCGPRRRPAEQGN